MVKEVYEIMRGDFQKLLNENYSTITIRRPDTTEGSFKEILTTDSTTTSYTIKVKLQRASEKNLDRSSLGELNPGDAVMYCKHEYDSDDDADISTTFTPQLGDWFTDADDIKWNIAQKVKGLRWKDYEIYMKFIVSRMP